jgi:ABC-2 type transport system permease protein
VGEILQFLSVDYHFENIARGVFDTRDVVFYLSLTAVGLMLTTRSLAAARQ